MKELDFSPCTAVEVNIDPDNSPDVWFPATFIRKVTNNSFLVEYKSSQEAGFQEVAVDLGHIRLSPPPQSSNKGFSLLEKVDAFLNFRWLSGVVTKILADGRYIVYFKRTKKEKELSHVDLRLHMEWTNGKWVNSSQDSSIASASEKERTCEPAGDAGTNHTVTLRSSHRVLRTPASKKSDNKTTMPSNKRIKESSHDVGTKCLKSSRRTNEKNASNAPLCPESPKLWLELTNAVHNGVSEVLDSSPIGNAIKSSSKQSDDSNQSSNPTRKMGNNEQHTVKRKRGRPPKRNKLPKQQALEQGSFIVDLRNVPTDAVEKTPNNGLNMKGESSKVMEDEEKQDNTKANHRSACNEQQKDGEVTNLKRKRGRPPKVFFRAGRSTTKKAERVVVETINKVENRVSVAECAGISRRRRWKIINHPVRKLITTTTSSGRVEKNFSKSPEETVTIESSEPVTLSRGKRRNPTKQVEPPTKDIGDYLSDKAAEVHDNGVSGDVENRAGTLSNVSDDDDRPLSAWFEGHEITKTEHVGHPYRDKALEKEKVTAENEDQSLTQSTAIVSVNNRELPFVKTSLIWSMIDSMEVIKQVPQNPHFSPLYNCKEECREGLAIGNMVTFTSLVDRISRLRFDDPESVFVGYFEALADLEDLGFNVGPVRDRLNSLLSIKGKYEQTQNTVNEIETQITERDHENSKINEEIEEIDNKISELNEKRARAMSKRETKEADMRLLKSTVDAVKGALESSKEEFEKVATSNW